MTTPHTPQGQQPQGQTGEVRLVPMTGEQAKRLSALLEEPDLITNGLDRLTMVSLALSFDSGITAEEADKAMHVSGSYTAERKKLRSAFLP